MNRFYSLFLISWFVSIAIFCDGCGYGFQGRGHLWSKHGIKKIYIPMVTNNSMITGIEVIFTRALIREFSRGNKLIVVNDEKNADATLVGVIGTSGSQGQAPSQITSTTKDSRVEKLQDVLTFTSYNAVSGLSVSLIRRETGTQLWSQGFSGSKIYPANNRFGEQGATSSLINSSQEQMALNEVAQIIASDVYDTMLEAF